jgi:Rieske 2Fe-2S family protein
MDYKTLIDARKPGHALERAFYTSQDIFQLDLDAIFGHHWIYVGVEPDVPEPGDVMTVDIGHHAVLIVRHDDMSVRAYHNACRHRGARLVDGPKGSVGNIVCRYHQWTYNLDGALMFAEHMNPDFDRSLLTRRRLISRIWRKPSRPISNGMMCGTARSPPRSI